MATTPVSFDPIAHKYWVTLPDGKKVCWPSVTTVTAAWKTAVTGKLAPWDDPANAFMAEKCAVARDKGLAVHEAIALDLHGQLDWKSIDPQIQGYMDAYRAVKGRLRLASQKNLQIEQVLVGEGYCGTADLITGKYLLDWKTGRHCWTHWMQLAAYRHCVDRYLKKAGCCYLAADGTYDLRWMDPAEYKRSWRWFWAAMDVLDCRAAHTRQKADE